ncbi:hypothetical protein [Bacillus sp. 1P06AnD]|uniref:hypothetical protein n=1 Tax=Bacillus sp. 1P06AnD TaxID=3132208 RepID=UPI0039A3EEA5
MKKKILLILLIVIIGFIGYTMFYNGFSNIKTITIKNYDKPSKEKVITSDKEKITKVTGILNRARHKRVSYKLAIDARYEMELTYNDKTKDSLWIYIGFDNNKTLLYGSNSNAYFITEKQTEKLLALLNVK